MPRIPVFAPSHPSHPVGSHRRQGLETIFTPVFSIHHSVYVLGKECELCSSPKIWGGAQESGEQTLPRKTSIWENPRFKNSWTREARNQWYLDFHLSTLSYMTGNQRFCSQKRIPVLRFLINMDSKTFLSFRLPVSLWLSFLPVPSFKPLKFAWSSLWLTCPFGFGVFRGFHKPIGGYLVITLNGMNYNNIVFQWMTKSRGE